MKKNKKTILLALSLIFLSCVSYSSQRTNSDKKNLVRSVPSIQGVAIGNGFLSDALLPIQFSCLKSLDINISNPTSSIILANDDDLSMVATKLNLDVSTKAGWKKFAVSSASNYLKEIAGSRYAMTFTFIDSVTGFASLDINDVFGEDALSETGKKFYRRSVDSFIERCGDQFIKGADVGAVLFVTLRINFSSQQQKSQFESEIKAGINHIMSASLKMKKLMELIGGTASIDVIAYQTGGQPQYLAQIFGTDNEHPLLHCSMENIDNCAKAIDSILDYAAGNNQWKETGFSKQIQNKDGELLADRLSIVNLTSAKIASYRAAFALDIISKPITKEVRAARLELIGLYDKYTDSAELAQSVTKSSVFKLLTDLSREKLKAIYHRIESNRQIFHSEQAMNCFLPDTQESCPEIVATIKEQLVEVDVTPLNSLKGAYYININSRYPLLLVKHKNEMRFMSLDLVLMDVLTHDLWVAPINNYSHMALRGGYSIFTNGIQTRYYMDFYDKEGMLPANPLITGYSGTVPWNTCHAGKCAKTFYPIELIPF